MELNVSVYSVFYFTLLFECVLQGNVVYRRLVQGVNCQLGSGCLTGMFRGCTWRHLGWTSFSNGVQEEGVRGDGGVGL